MREDRQISERTDRALVVGCVAFVLLLTIIIVGTLLALGAR